MQYPSKFEHLSPNFEQPSSGGVKAVEISVEGSPSKGGKLSKIGLKDVFEKF